MTTPSDNDRSREALADSLAWWKGEWEIKNHEAERLWLALLIFVPLAFIAGDVLGWVLHA